jgi:hypothetical protein
VLDSLAASVEDAELGSSMRAPQPVINNAIRSARMARQQGPHHSETKKCAAFMNAEVCRGSRPAIGASRSSIALMLGKNNVEIMCGRYLTCARDRLGAVTCFGTQSGSTTAGRLKIACP